MPIFEMRGPDGREFEVNAPDAQTAATKFKSAMAGRRIDGAFHAADDQPQPEEQPVYSGTILPRVRYADGREEWSSDAGIVGAVKRVVGLPGDVYAGRVDPRSDAGIERAAEMAAMALPVSPAFRGPSWAARRANVPAPSAEELKAAGSGGYNQARQMGVDYSSDAVRGMADALRARLEGDGILAELAPKSFRILERLANPPNGSVAPLVGLEAARRAFRNARKDFSNPTEKLAAERIIRGLDQFMEGANPASVVAGPAAAAGRTLADARGNYAAAKRSETLTNLGERAENRAVATNSGQNIDNAIRQRAVDILDPAYPHRRAGFSKEEVRAIERVANGNTGRNLLRYVGNLLGGGGGLGAAVIGGGAGGLAGGWVGGATGAAAGIGAAATGLVSKKGANALAKRHLRQADELVRQRSPLYERMLQDAPMEAPPALRRAAALRAAGLVAPGALGGPPRDR
jgi:hypothetical protein